MENLTPSKKLDLILRYLKDNERYPKTFDNIFESVNGLSWKGTILKDEIPDKITAKDTQKVLDKLFKDGLIDKTETQLGHNQKEIKYSINFEGDSLLELEDGFSGRLKTKKATEATEKLNSRQLKFFSILAAIGTVGLLFWEIVKYLLQGGYIPVCLYFFLLFVSYMMYRLVKKLP